MLSEDSFIRRHKILTVLIVLVILILLLVIRVFSWRFGPHYTYSLDLMIPADGKPTEEPGTLEVGVAKREITIDLSRYDTWVDGNNNNEYDIWTDTLTPRQKMLFAAVNRFAKVYDPQKAAQSGDSYVDRNGNGRFDTAWVAGFGVNRPAKGVHDPQWVRALALRNNGVTVALVSIDAIGLFLTDILDIRKAVNPAFKIDHIVISSTHSHEVPDTMMGMWSGPVPLLNYDPSYIASIKQKAVEAIEEAVASLTPADMRVATVELPMEGFVHDSRKPIVLDTNAYAWWFTRAGTQTTIATMVNWAQHPEALGGDNPYLSSDFVHYLRQGMEEGVPDPNGEKGLGGTCVYFQGPQGGLANPLHVTVPKRDGSGSIEEDSFEKAEHMGYNVALNALRALRGPNAWVNEKPMLAVAAKTFKAKMDGMFRYAIMLGFIHPGYYWGGYAKTEVNAIRIGDVMVSTVPGELYPEILIGGVEAKPGRDFEIPPVEVPPVRTEQTRYAKQAATFGLANDEIGYIIPKSQWDTKPPFVYDRSQYGEQNSGGPEVGPAIHKAMTEMAARVNKTYENVPPRVAASR